MGFLEVMLIVVLSLFTILQVVVLIASIEQVRMIRQDRAVLKNLRRRIVLLENDVNKINMAIRLLKTDIRGHIMDDDRHNMIVHKEEQTT